MAPTITDVVLEEDTVYLAGFQVADSCCGSCMKVRRVGVSNDKLRDESSRKRGVRVRVHRLSEGEKNYLTSIAYTSKLTRAL